MTEHIYTEYIYTERIYYEQAYQTECSAVVVKIDQINQHTALLLDRSVFYPTSGGQANDTGKIAEQAVVDVIVDEQGAVWHLLAHDAIAPTIGQSVDCKIDWARRYDHMQQHAGQHLISQVFYRLFAYETVSVHFGESESTLDLDVPAIEAAQLEAAEHHANQLAYSALPIRAYIVDEADLASIPLRRAPKVSGKIRIVEIDGFDYSACGGTHTRTTAEILPIKFIKQEKRRNQTRLTFLCGKRAVRDYEEKHRLLTTIAGRFSTEITQTVPLLDRLIAQNRELQGTVEALTTQLLRAEAATLYSQAEMHNGIRVLTLAEGQRDLAAIKTLAQLLTEQPGMVALFACASGDKATLVFARSADLQPHMGNLLKSTLQRFGGNGGGKPEFAQGGGAMWEQAQAMLAFAREQLKIMTG